jgi:hypothetical protein
MSLSLDAFTAASNPSWPKCPIVRIFDVLDPKDAAVLTAALADRDVTHAAIANVLTSNGHRIVQDAVGRHRRGACSCAR